MSTTTSHSDVKTEYVIRQLGRTTNKKYEAYIITRIIHKLDNFDIKFVTQQYVSRSDEKHALTDLFFPQLNFHIEVDEGFHKNHWNVKADDIREQDIAMAVPGTIFKRIDATMTLDQINIRVDALVDELRKEIIKLTSNSTYIPWDIDAEHNPETYLEKGYIDLEDNVAFKRIYEACNCFGHQYIGFQRGGAGHRDDGTILWFPKLYPNDEWNNSISQNEEQIVEKHHVPETAKIHVAEHINGSSIKRIVFARVKNNLGEIMYRFKGCYKLNVPESKSRNALIWDRIETRVKTYRPTAI